MLKSADLSFHYPQGPTFQYPDFELSEGGSLLITGASGSGKSTLLQLISGLRKPDGGQVIWQEHATHNLSVNVRGRLIGWVFQQMYFIPSLTVQQNIKLPGSFQSRASSASDIKSLAKELNIDHLLDSPIQQCSRGEQQRISFLRALVHEPSLILADEPTSSLDDSNCTKLTQLMLQLCAEKNKTLLVVSHDNRLIPYFERRVEL